MLVELLLVILGILGVWQVLFRIVRKFLHFPAPAFMGRFLNSRVRKAMQPPFLVISRSGIKYGMKVLEIGSGSGAFTFQAAKAAGKTGTVNALDIQPDMLKQLERKMKKRENKGLKNIKPVLGNAYELPFGNGSLDLVFMVTVLQEIPDKKKALAEIMRVLKPGGILAVTEFLPDPDYPRSITTVKQVTREGFKFDKLEGGVWNYTARFVKP